MKIIAEYKGEEILLKNYNSYLELDRTLSSFESKEDLMEKLNLDLETDNIYVLDNNGKIMDNDPKMIRTVLSFYEQGKGEEFVKWIYSGISEKDYGWSNKGTLARYFSDRQLEFTKGKTEKEFNTSSINNNEGKRLYTLIRKIKTNLITYDVIPSTFKTFEYDILPGIEEYVKRNGEYDYAYMRKFGNTLSTRYSYSLKEPNIQLVDINEIIQGKILDGFKTAIHNYVYNKKQVTLDELTTEQAETGFVYDENGEIIKEKPFYQETMEKSKNLNLRG